jgi:hypothetical protein
VRRLLLAVVWGALAAPVAAETSVPLNCARVEASLERTLCHELVLPAPAAEVWRLMSTSEGWRAWAAPVAEIDLRSGDCLRRRIVRMGASAIPAISAIACWRSHQSGCW